MTLLLHSRIAQVMVLVLLTLFHLGNGQYAASPATVPVAQGSTYGMNSAVYGQPGVYRQTSYGSQYGVQRSQYGTYSQGSYVQGWSGYDSWTMCNKQQTTQFSSQNMEYTNATNNSVHCFPGGHIFSWINHEVNRLWFAILDDRMFFHAFAVIALIFFKLHVKARNIWFHFWLVASLRDNRVLCHKNLFWFPLG